MADIEIIVTSPSSGIRAIATQSRRLSVPTIIKPLPRRTRQQSLSQTSKPSSWATSKTPQRSLLYHLHTLLLFTFSDIKNILIPQTLLGLVTALCCSHPSTPSAVLGRLPHTIAWVWLHLLVFNTSNQTQPSSQIEDLQNKPWRPLPSKRISHGEARALFYATSALATMLSVGIGGLRESALLMGLYVLNNDLSLGDSGAVSRNALNAAGYTTFAFGAVAILTHGTGCAVTQQGYLWLLLLAAVILTTGQCQDLEDQDGDRAKGRSTIPLLFGDEVGRWSVIVPMAGWTFFAPRYWDCNFQYSMVLLAIGAVVMKRLVIGDKEGYKKTFRLWNCWIIALYMLPAFRNGM
ncbi:MAG: hypothetical protein Q9218_001890 [Villophora microphyllina]